MSMTAAFSAFPPQPERLSTKAQSKTHASIFRIQSPPWILHIIPFISPAGVADL
jgi:hypothetical protein